MFHVCLLIAVGFALAAVLCAFATFSRSPTVRRTANRAIYGSLAAALISAALAAWFFHRAKTTPAPMRLGIADKPTVDHFRQCPICGHMIDGRDLAEVIEHISLHQAPQKNKPNTVMRPGGDTMSREKPMQ
jgi:hypothetical protein